MLKRTSDNIFTVTWNGLSKAQPCYLNKCDRMILSSARWHWLNCFQWEC